MMSEIETFSSVLLRRKDKLAFVLKKYYKISYKEYFEQTEKILIMTADVF